MNAMTSPKVYFISRHMGAVAWAKRQGIEVDELLSHLEDEEMDSLNAGDTVIGTLPVHLAARVCARGARYIHLSMEMRPEMRGIELTADDMDRCLARLEAFDITQSPL